MNKKQLIITWVIGIYVSTFFVLQQTIYPIIISRKASPFDLSGIPDKYFWITIGIVLWKPISVLLIPFLIIGSLLIYTLRTRK